MAIIINNHVFKGHKALLGHRYVTYAEIELPTRYDKFASSKSGFDWGSKSSGSKQLAFAMLYKLTNEEYAKKYTLKFTDEVVKTLNSRDWSLDAVDVYNWVEKNNEEKLFKPKTTTIKKITPVKKTNVVKDVCKELGITQKTLAKILEIPEGTVSSWAVKNEIPRLGKKAIEFYILSVKNQKIIDSYKDFAKLLDSA